MQSRWGRLFIIISLLSLVITSATLGYVRRIDADTFALTLKTNTTLYQGEKIRQLELQDSIQKAQDELTKKEQQVQAKQAELAKAEEDLTSKIKELDSAKKKIQDQQSQLSTNATELKRLSNRPPLFNFKVESSSLANVEQKKEDVKSVVTAAYDTIGDIYGTPYLLSSVTISFVDSFSIAAAAAETVISNGAEGLSITIKLKDFDKTSFNDVSSVIHELVHAYHGIAILDPVAYEEGITVAMTDAVMSQLILAGKIPSFKPLYIRLSSSDYLNSSLTLPRSATSFYTSSQVATYYQIAGYGWYQLYKADSGFFKKFNDYIYTQKRNGNEITESVVKDALHHGFSGTVQGKTLDQWIDTKAFKLQ